MKALWFYSIVLLLFVFLTSIGLTQEILTIADNFYATGFMGDGEIKDGKYIIINERFSDKERPDSACIKISYKLGPNRWGGLYWQNEPDNWGDLSGMDLSSYGYKKITFWAKGAIGDEIVEFKSGGTATPGKPYKDSFLATSIPKKVKLSTKWQKYLINLENKNITSVIGGFCWAANDAGNPNGLTFFLDEIQFE